MKIGCSIMLNFSTGSWKRFWIYFCLLFLDSIIARTRRFFLVFKNVSFLFWKLISFGFGRRADGVWSRTQAWFIWFSKFIGEAESFFLFRIQGLVFQVIVVIRGCFFYPLSNWIFSSGFFRLRLSIASWSRRSKSNFIKSSIRLLE